MRSERVHYLNTLEVTSGEYVLYRMQASVRIIDNWSLRYAIEEANRLHLPLLVVFIVNQEYPEANFRHFKFLFEGLRDVESKLFAKGIDFCLLNGRVEDVLPSFLKKSALVVTDKGYLRIQRRWSDWIASHASSLVVEIEDNLMVPICSASHKAEWAARTIRPKIMGKLDYFSNDSVGDLPELKIRNDSFEKSIELNRNVEASVLSFQYDNRYLGAGMFIGGESEAIRMLHEFIQVRLLEYQQGRNDPSMRATTRLSPYLHFGNITPITILRYLKEILHANNSLQNSVDVLLEELLVRRELAYNFVYYTSDYDSYSSLPGWAQKTLASHQDDPRPFLYTIEQLVACQTHDVCWNASMKELIDTGYMENTMRMYWAKKIIEWSQTPQEAYRIALELNNRYQLDGRDANSFVGIAWCFGLHDRPWKERSIFGLVRYMGESGLRRKYHMEHYIQRNMGR